MKRYQWAVIDAGVIVQQCDEWAAAIRYAFYFVEMALLMFGAVRSKIRVQRIEVDQCAA